MKRIAGNIVNLQPLYPIPFNGCCHIMNGVGAIGEPHVENRGDLCMRRGAAPKQVRSMEVVVGPERLKHTEEWTQHLIQGQKRSLCLTEPIAFREVSLKRGPVLDVTREFEPRTVTGKNLEAGHQGCRTTRGHRVSRG